MSATADRAVSWKNMWPAGTAQKLISDPYFKPLHTLTRLLLDRKGSTAADRAYLMGLSVEEASAHQELRDLLHDFELMTDCHIQDTIGNVVCGIHRFATGVKKPEGMKWTCWVLGIDQNYSHNPAELEGVSARLRAAPVGRWLPWGKGGVTDSWSSATANLVAPIEADQPVADVIQMLWQQCEQERNAHQALVAKIAGK